VPAALLGSHLVDALRIGVMGEASVRPLKGQQIIKQSMPAFDKAGIVGADT
jgi:hypothetical protein